MEISTEKITQLCKVFSSPNRISVMIRLARGQVAMKIAEDLGMSRAGVQRHIDMLEETGILFREGSGRNTRYRILPIGQHLYRELGALAILTEMQREFNKINDAIELIRDFGAEETTASKFLETLEKKREELLLELLVIRE